MRNDLKYMAFLYGQITSMVLLIILIWTLNDEVLNKIKFDIFLSNYQQIRILLSFFILFVFLFSIYKTIRKFSAKNKN